ncbi:MAG: PP2C family protein-serine/threonine phosphatase, partial [Prevotella sp.]|nr:PP2C family protein-serine/threonine phosphatase [Prevotella sp.]
KDSTVNELFEHAYQRHITHVNESHSKEAYRDAVVGLINIAYGWLSEKQYNMGLLWTERFGTLVADYKKRYVDDENYIDKQWARYLIFTAVGMEGQGKMAEAAEAYASYQQTRFAHTIEGQLDGSDYLSMAGYWQEAAENLTDIEKAFVSEQTGHSLEDIQRYWLKKYHANDKAGLRDTANLVANKICQRLDSAIVKSQWVDAEEQEVIRQKEEQILHQQERLARAQMWGFIASIVSLTIFFVIFTIIRHRAAKRLAKVTAAKERMEGELSIARDIQMSMVPSHFPDYQGLDMHASMTPAKEVGGDLYGYVLQGDKLYFCLGDVSGKGVPASLFMAQSTRLFHTLATQQLQPAEICNHMNRELSGEDNVNGMFVTLFLGLLDLKTGHLTFCNAGHNPPVIDAGTPEAAFIDMQPNAPIGLWAELDYEQEDIESIMGRAFFIYTDGLNEAEDAQQNQFGDDRLLDILRSNQYETAWGMVTRLAKDVEQHRNGAEPNDDLTMLCLKFSK